MLRLQHRAGGWLQLGNHVAPSPGSAVADRCLAGILHTAPVAGAAGSLLACLRDTATTSPGSLSTTGGSPSGSWDHSRQRWFQGHPDDAQHWRGKRAPANAVGALSAAKGEGAQRPKGCRLCRPPSVARCHPPLCPLPFSLASGALAEDREVSAGVSAESGAYHTASYPTIYGSYS